jgi:hypothetical protein
MWLAVPVGGRLTAEDLAPAADGSTLEDLDWMVGSWVLVPDDEAATKQRLNTAFAAFDTDLSAEHELTGPDQERIRGQVIAELKARVKRKFGGLFAETRSVGGISRTVSPDGFDFLDVGEGGLEAVRPTAEGTRPF